MISSDPIPALRLESIHSGTHTPTLIPSPGVALRILVSSGCGSTELSTGTATLEPGAMLPLHDHSFSEAVTILEGDAEFRLEGRRQRLGRLDCLHVPAGTAHSVRNPSATETLRLHWVFASAEPTRRLLDTVFPDSDLPGRETVRRYGVSEKYELSERAMFCDLFASRFGSVGICGGYGRFAPGASLPCHFHDFDESITIVEGEATCLVAGRRYSLASCDTAFVPRGQPHRFLNETDRDMAMIWVYGGSEPERTLIKFEFCSGALAWPGPPALQTR